MDQYLIKLPEEFTNSGATRGSYTLNPLEKYIDIFADAAECPKSNIINDIVYEVVDMRSGGAPIKSHWLCLSLTEECYNKIIKDGLLAEDSILTKKAYKEMIAKIKNNELKAAVFAIKFSNNKTKVKKLAGPGENISSADNSECIIL